MTKNPFKSEIKIDEFRKFRDNIIGYCREFITPYGIKKLVYADWTASGRLYKPIEEKISNEFGTLLGNTHTETNVTGSCMTLSYTKAKKIIRDHVNANENDVVLGTGSGMTGAILKLQRMLGFKVPSRLKKFVNIPIDFKPVIFVTHMEHHSNQTTWLESIADVEIIDADEEGLADLKSLEKLIKKYSDRKIKIASITSCSNVTGIFTPYHKIAAIMHKNNGWCFVDFACSAPYIEINMHPKDPFEKLDAIFFSPHKFLGGPGSSGILIFDRSLYDSHFSPDQPGGGTVKWTNPWGEHSFYDDIELREDGGTPPFLQTIKAALAIKLKDELGVVNIAIREKAITKKVLQRLKNINGVHVLADNIEERLPVISFYIEGLHYNLGVRLLNDRYGIQVRGGCSCAGTYGHYLLHVSKQQSHKITEMIEHHDLSEKPGWIRISLHPVMTDAEIDLILEAVEEISINFRDWAKDYIYDPHENNFSHKLNPNFETNSVDEWFS
ncbi:MAG: aminotransferase class V-fold PLP-dependent enzyme [Ignavibacteria bacterium]|nr:aminotransferase class V-fold PLP-dependent enzyme [Ignavibacteria bacterium]